MPEKEYLYVTFFSTKGKMGRFIRAVTHYPFNHVSVSLDPELNSLYSFARKYKAAPFCGGFVHESCKRYSFGGRNALIKVCAVPIDSRDKESVVKRIREMEKERSKYLYNFISAATFPMRIRVQLEYAFTCVEFVRDILSGCGVLHELEKKDCVTIRDLDRCLSEYTVYRGNITGYVKADSWGDDTYAVRERLIVRAGKTIGSGARLIYYWAHS